MMKRLVIVLVLFIFQSLRAQENEEFRATWVITWEHIMPDSNTEANKALVRKIMDDHKRANMNAVVWQARQSGTAYYNSSYEPWGFYAGYKHPGYDPLAYAIEQAHARGLELHAWMNVFESRDTSAGSPASTHPEWVCRDQDGRPMTDKPSLSPGLAQVREYLVKVAMGIVRNYDIDGLHLDYVRWNEFSSSAQFAKVSEGQRFPEGAIGDDQVQDLLRNAAGRYLYDVEHPYSAVVQSGFCQAHRGNSLSLDQRPGILQCAAGGCPQCWGQYIQPGIQAGRLYTVGPPSYILADNKIWNRHLEIAQAVKKPEC
jgi:hypothetical protein